MTATNPPNLQVVGPASEPAPAPEPQKDYVDPGPAEDRILSPEETENFFRTGSIEDPEVKADPPVTDPEQQKMVGEHFDGIQGEPAARPKGVAPGQVDPTVAQAAVQQDLQPQQIPVVPGQPPTPVPGAPQAPLQAPAMSPTEAALQGQVQGLMTQVQQLTAAMSQQAQQVQPQQQQQVAAQPAFNFQIPQQYADAIGSEDPNIRSQAINSLFNGLAQVVHKQTLQDVDAKINQITPVLDQRTELRESQSEIKRDMYSAYPELAGMEAMVAAAATQLQGQFPGGWSPDYRDAIAERLSPLVQGLPQKVQQQRAARGVVPQVVQQQFLPQGTPLGLPPGVAPVQVQGGVHMAPAAVQPGQPVLVRDAAGNYSQVVPQQAQQFAGPQARSGGQGQVDAGLQDIWSTLGYT